MPQLNRVLTETDLKSSRTPSVMDLAPYLGIIDEVTGQEGLGGEVNLGADESQRTEKRRLSLAAKQRGFKLTWRKSGARQLRFVLSAPGSPAPGGRKRR